MSVWKHLRKEAERQERQRLASERVDVWCQEVREQAQAIGAMHRRYRQPAGVKE